MLYVVRCGVLHHGSFLKPCKDPPLALGLDRCFRHILLTGPPAPMGAPPCPWSIQQRHHPPSGLQLWPGHSLHFNLRVPWQSTYQPLPAHWPRAWSAHLLTWHMQHCPDQSFQWCTSPWTLASPAVFTPVQVRYQPISGHAEWTFELKER